MGYLTALKMFADNQGSHNKALVRAQTTLRFVCGALLGRYKWRKSIGSPTGSKISI